MTNDDNDYNEHDHERVRREQEVWQEAAVQLLHPSEPAQHLFG